MAEGEHTLSGVHQRWFRRERGILAATLREFGVYSEGEDEVSYPYQGFVKSRGGFAGGERTFRLRKHPKTKLQLWGLDQLPETPPHTLILCEGETDTMRLWQELAEHGVEGFGVLGLPGVQAWQHHMAEAFDACNRVYVILDNDEYGSPAQRATHQAWRKIRATVGPKARRVSLEEAGCKDLCEFFRAFTLEDMGQLFRREPDWHFAALNLHDLHLPRETTWFIDGLLAVEDTGMLTGDSGVGKSLLALDLSVAAIAGRPWCGQTVRSYGARVLYVDEENPESLVVQRAHRLGMTDTMAQNVRYVCMQGISLERDFEELLEDAQRFDPDLIVLDTLVQLHDGEEIDARAMTRLFSKFIKPLGRECKATVLALHHVNKPRHDSSGNVVGNASSRVRGSTAIKASVDSAIEARQGQRPANHIVLDQFKSRRTIPVRPIKVTFGDLPDGRLEVSAL